MAQKLLLIEENRQLLDLVAGFLSNLGYEVHSAREYDEAHALLMNYHYKIIISGEEPASFGTPEDNLAKCIDAMVQKPCVIRLHEGTSESHHTTSPVEPSLVFLEKPISLLRLGDLMRKISSN
jgi:DNA-binding NtrC family response regulator